LNFEKQFAGKIIYRKINTRYGNVVDFSGSC